PRSRTRRVRRSLPASQSPGNSDRPGRRIRRTAYAFCEVLPMAPRRTGPHAREMSATVIQLPRRRHHRVAAMQTMGTGILGALLWTAFAVEHIHVFLRTGRVVGIGLAVVELYAAALFMMRRPAQRTSQRSLDWTVALTGTFGALALRPGGAHSPAGDALGLAIQAIGVLIVLTGLGALGRSIGQVA